MAKTIVIGNTVIALQSFVVLVAGLVLSILLAFKNISLSISMLIIFTVASYSINCIEFGQCHTWATVVSILYVIQAMMVLVSAYWGGVRK